MRIFKCFAVILAFENPPQAWMVIGDFSILYVFSNQPYDMLTVFFKHKLEPPLKV